MISAGAFSRPFPARPFGKKVAFGHGRTALFVFVALLFVFPPLTALAYGVVVFLVAVTYHVISEWLGAKRSGPEWTLLRWTIDQAMLLFIVSTACFLLLNYYRGWTLMSWRVLLYVTVPTVLVGLIPIVLSGMAVQLQYEREKGIEP